ncbi:hypothetical protein ANO11243_049140 [Dothideomycetidae sp. 11243]|nr:hypothetical protein ANO11243_049140 [fungal sp. No.11243]
MAGAFQSPGRASPPTSQAGEAHQRSSFSCRREPRAVLWCAVVCPVAGGKGAGGDVSGQLARGLTAASQQFGPHFGFPIGLSFVLRRPAVVASRGGRERGCGTARLHAKPTIASACVSASPSPPPPSDSQASSVVRSCDDNRIVIIIALLFWRRAAANPGPGRAARPQWTLKRDLGTLDCLPATPPLLRKPYRPSFSPIIIILHLPTLLLRPICCHLAGVSTAVKTTGSHVCWP